MAAIGDASLWSDTLPDGLIPDIIAMILSAWAKFKKPSSNAREVVTTRKFRVELVRSVELQALPLRIDPEVPISDPVTGEEIGRLDLRFTTAERLKDNVYFAVECKRLYVRSSKKKPPTALADRYVLKGMMRFVKEQYSRDLTDGAMLAYVMTGSRERAIQAVQDNLGPKCTDLGMKPPGEFMNSYASNDSAVRMTEHARAGGPFRLQHLFLLCAPPSP